MLNYLKQEDPTFASKIRSITLNYDTGNTKREIEKQMNVLNKQYFKGNFDKSSTYSNKIDEHNYEGTASDVVGKARGHSYGPAFKFEYVLLVPVKGKEMKITFDDWIFKQDEKVAINRATMTKFGIKVAELTVLFQKN